jgi:hypothetical protein
MEGFFSAIFTYTYGQGVWMCVTCRAEQHAGMYTYTYGQGVCLCVTCLRSITQVRIAPPALRGRNHSFSRGNEVIEAEGHLNEWRFNTVHPSSS